MGDSPRTRTADLDRFRVEKSRQRFLAANRGQELAAQLGNSFGNQHGLWEPTLPWEHTFGNQHGPNVWSRPEPLADGPPVVHHATIGALCTAGPGEQGTRTFGKDLASEVGVPREKEIDWSDRATVLAAVRKDGILLEFAPDFLRSRDKDVVLAALGNTGLALQFVGYPLRADRDIVLAAVTNSGTEQSRRRVFLYADASLRDDPEIIIRAIKIDPSVFQWAPSQLREWIPEVMAAAIEHGAVEFHPEMQPKELREAKNVVLAAVAKDGRRALPWAAFHFRDNKEVVIAACQNNGLALEFASESLRADRKVVLAALQNNSLRGIFGASLEFVSEALDPAVVVEAIEEGILVIEDFDEDFPPSGTKSVVLAAVVSKYGRRTLERAASHAAARWRAAIASVL